jgi:hypothetical protein
MKRLFNTGGYLRESAHFEYDGKREMVLKGFWHSQTKGNK